MKLIRIHILFALCSVALAGRLNAQDIRAGVGIGSLRLGMNYGEVEWELGFRGFRTVRAEATAADLEYARQAGLEFDTVVRYEHIMWLPVASVFFRDGRAEMIVVSSYPEYFRMLCSDLLTEKNLAFWTGEKEVRERYGRNKIQKKDGFEFIAYRDQGLLLALDRGQVRTMCIFAAAMP
jgi:hypothetical protein